MSNFNDDDFDFESFEDGFEDGSDEDQFSEYLSSEENMLAEDVFKDAIDGYVRFNYDAIQMYGVNVESTRTMINLDPNALVKFKNTLEFMLSHFIKTEEYEKCAVINKYLEQI